MTPRARIVSLGIAVTAAALLVVIRRPVVPPEVPGSWQPAEPRPR